MYLPAAMWDDAADPPNLIGDMHKQASEHATKNACRATNCDDVDTFDAFNAAPVIDPLEHIGNISQPTKNAANVDGNVEVNVTDDEFESVLAHDMDDDHTASFASAKEFTESCANDDDADMSEYDMQDAAMTEFKRQQHDLECLQRGLKDIQDVKAKTDHASTDGSPHMHVEEGTQRSRMVMETEHVLESGLLAMSKGTRRDRDDNNSHMATDKTYTKRMEKRAPSSHYERHDRLAADINQAHIHDSRRYGSTERHNSSTSETDRSSEYATFIDELLALFALTEKSIRLRVQVWIRLVLQEILRRLRP
jgi:hypothetical protein